MLIEVKLFLESDRDMEDFGEFITSVQARQNMRNAKPVAAFEPRSAEPTEDEVAAVLAVLDRAEVPNAPVVEEAQVIEVTVAPTISGADATDVLHKYVAKKGAPAAMALFSEYGAKRLGDVPSDKRAELVGRMQEAL